MADAPGGVVQAEQQFKAALDQQPNDFWLNFQLARCSFELRHFEPALVAASICVALEPSHAECYYNRALCHESLQQNDKALADFDHTLKLAPDFAARFLGTRCSFMEVAEVNQSAMSCT